MTTALRTFYEDGQLVEADDLNNDGYTVGTVAGDVLACFFGPKETFPAVDPLTITPGVGLTVLVGGDGERMIVRDASGSLQVADYIPQETLTFAQADPAQARIDTIAGVYFEVGVGAIIRDYCDTSDTITPGGVSSHYVGRSMQFQVVEGTPGATTPPPAPAGTYVIAEVTIPAGANSLNSANVQTVPLALGAQLAASGAGGNRQAVSNDHSIDITESVVNGQDTINFQVDYAVVSAALNLDTTYESSDQSISITEHQDPNNPRNRILDFTTGKTQGSIGGSQTIAGQAGIIYSSFRTNIGTQAQGLESPNDQNYTGIAAPLGFVNYVQIKNIAQVAQYEFGIRVASGAGPQSVSGFALVTGNFFVALDGVIVFGPVSGNLAQAWSATIPDNTDGQVHTLVFHCDNNGPSAMVLSAWVPHNAAGGVDASKFDYVGPITHYP